MPNEILIAMPVGLGMAFCQTHAASAVGSGYRGKPGNTVCMAVVSSITQGDYLQDFSRVLHQALPVHPWMIKMRSWLVMQPGGTHPGFQPTLQNQAQLASLK